MAASCAVGGESGFLALGYLRVAFLGVIQGITELLPISSTAHMRVVPALLGWPDPGAAFSAAMQLAALVGVVTYFWRDIKGIVSASTGALSRRDYTDHSLRLVFFIIIATVPIVIAGVALASTINACDSPLRSLSAIGTACIIMGLLLAVTELYAHHRRTMSDITFFDAIMVGIAQAFVLVPGASRSGTTLTAALALGFKREEAARFSFLLGIPAIVLAGGKEIWELHKMHLGFQGWEILGVGLVVGGLSSVVAIWGLMRFLERFSTWPFVIYRVLLGLLLLAGAAGGCLT